MDNPTATQAPPPPRSKGEWIAGGVIVVLVLAACSAGGSGKPDATPGPSTAAVVAPAPTDSATPAPADNVTLALTPEPTPALTFHQRNAIATVRVDLEGQADTEGRGRSRAGLIAALYDQGYEMDVATFAVDWLKVDWNAQAYLAAKHLRGWDQRHSPDYVWAKLMDQGFTKAQAHDAIDKAFGGHQVIHDFPLAR